jgi:hypothetical protein
LAIYGLFFCFDSCIVASDSHYPTVAVWDTRASDAPVRELRFGDHGEATCVKYQEFGNDQVIYINMRHILYVCMLEIFVDQKRKRGWVSRIYGLDAYFLLTDSKFVYWFIVYPRVLCFPLYISYVLFGQFQHLVGGGSDGQMCLWDLRAADNPTEQWSLIDLMRNQNLIVICYLSLIVYIRVTYYICSIINSYFYLCRKKDSRIAVSLVSTP